MTDLIKIGTVTTFENTTGSPLSFSHTSVGSGTEINRMTILTVTIFSTTGPTDLAATYGGASFNTRAVNSDTLGPGQRLHITFDMDETLIPADGAQTVEVTFTGGGSVSSVTGTISQYAGVQQTLDGVPTNSFAKNTGSTVSNQNDVDADQLLYVAMVGDDNASWTHNHSQVEIAEFVMNGGVATHAVTATIVPTDITSAITNTFGISANLMANQLVYAEERAPTLFAATVNAVSSVTVAMDIPRMFSTTVSATATVSPNTFVYFRKFSTTVAVVSGIVTSLTRSVAFQTTVNVVSGVTAQQLERAIDFAAQVNAVATSTGLFGATRPFSAQVDAVSTVTAQFGSDFDENKSSLTPGDYIELFEVDTTVIGGADVFRFVQSGFVASDVVWQGETFTRFPIEMDGFEWNATAQAPPQPTLRLSNANNFTLQAVINLGDMVGAKVTRWRTYTQFLDGMPTEDPNAHFPPDTFLIQQKLNHSKLLMEWSLSSAIDQPGLRLPKRQILRDQTAGNLHAPGVSAVRFRGR